MAVCHPQAGTDEAALSPQPSCVTVTQDGGGERGDVAQDAHQGHGRPQHEP